MSKTIRNMKPWPAGLPLPAGALTFFYHPGDDDEYHIDPARFGAGGSGETAALVAVDAAASALVYEVAKGLTQADLAGLSLGITTAAGTNIVQPTTTHVGFADFGTGTTYDSATGWLYVVLSAGIDVTDVLSVHLCRIIAGQEQVLHSELFPFGGWGSAIVRLELPIAQPQPAASEVAAPALHAITGLWNGDVTNTTVYVQGLEPTAFASTGWVLVNGVPQAVKVDVVAGAWAVLDLGLLAPVVYRPYQAAPAGYPTLAAAVATGRISDEDTIYLNRGVQEDISLDAGYYIGNFCQLAGLTPGGLVLTNGFVTQARITNTSFQGSCYTAICQLGGGLIVATGSTLRLGPATVLPAGFFNSFTQNPDGSYSTPQGGTVLDERGGTGGGSSTLLTGTYTVQPADVTSPATALVIPVADALAFGTVGVAVPGVSGQDILTPGSDYTSAAGQLTISAGLNPPLQAGYEVHYAYLTGSVAAAGVTPAQLAAVATTLPLTPPRTAQYLLQLSDAGCLVPIVSASPLLVIVPDNATVAFPVGTTLYVGQHGTGQVKIIPRLSGVTINVTEGYLVPGQWFSVTLLKIDLDTWILTGGIS